MNRRWVPPALAMVIVATLGSNVGVVLARIDRPDAASPAVVEQVPDKLQDVLPELQAFVEQARGLQFKRPPKVALLADDEFEGLLGAGEDPEEDSGSQDQAAFLGVMRALGLFGADVDLDAEAQEQADAITGLYDFEAQALYVRSVDPTPYAKGVLVHELTHALDDQHFGLDRPEIQNSDDGEALSAFQALVEGSAEVVEQAWHDSRPEQEQDAGDAPDRAAVEGADRQSEPDVFAKALAFPYEVGPGFVAALRAQGGQAGLDAAFRNPPTTTEQVLHPQRFLTGEGAREVPPPPAGGEEIEKGTLGELGLILVTDTAVSSDSALRASSGWGGDSFRAWSDGDRTCIRWDIRMDTPADSGELVEAMQAWAGDHPGAEVAGTDPVEITNCA